MSAEVSQTSSAGFMERIEQGYPTDVLNMLLADHTTQGNILWADDEYEVLGEGYQFNDEIALVSITGVNSGVIKPRTAKEMERQSQRTKSHAEVFTPSWLCNQMNNYLDEGWLGRKSVFTVEDAQSWEPTEEPIEFPREKGRGWQAYVDSPRLEITCGEAPFICSRYDTVSGTPLPVPKRIGFLDRKLRVVSEKTRTRKDWSKWALRALKATYGYEYQGDNLVLARINVLETLVEHCVERWGERPSDDEIAQAAKVVSWNLWQMDGRTCAIPSGEPAAAVQPPLFELAKPEPEQMSMLDLLDDWAEPEREESAGKSVPLCVVYDWEANEPVVFASLKSKEQHMKKFYAVIGNPPYQETVEGTSDRPIYNFFVDESFEIAQKVELITPARFLFNAGKTPKEWNKKMLADPHVKILEYEQSSSSVFPNTDIKGGVAITYRNSAENFGSIGVFSAFAELRSIQKKITPFLENGSLSSVMYPQNRFNLDALYADYPEARESISSDGRERRIVTSSFNKLRCFTKQAQDENDIRILGLEAGNNRVFKWISRNYVDDNGNLEKYKVILPMANGSGALGEVLSTPLIGEPLIGYTQTFMGIGSVDNRAEAESIMKYIKTKTARALLGILKITQHNTAEKWAYVPLQDFTPNSDVDWSKPVPEIDQQLYAKYGLDEDEINFIETHVKEMS